MSPALRAALNAYAKRIGKPSVEEVLGEVPRQEKPEGRRRSKPYWLHET